MRESSPASGGRARIRRLIRLLILDAVLLTLLIVGVGLEMGRFVVVLHSFLAWPDALARTAVVGGAIVVAIPLVVGLIRLTWRLALALAVRALPQDGGGVDFARAPRTAFVVTLQIALLLAILAPVSAATQSVVRGAPTPLVLLVVTSILAISFWRAARNLHGHARAGAEVIVSTLARHVAGGERADQLTQAMAQVSDALPGLGEPEPIVVDRQSNVVGRSLRDVNLRGLTGATVLAIVRGSGDESQVLIPSGREGLRAGDVLAVAGSRAAVAAARELLR